MAASGRKPSFATFAESTSPAECNASTHIAPYRVSGPSAPTTLFCA
jgi:hypothetical protein